MKKIYIEITNNCNLNCDFCIKNERKSQFMTLDNFSLILDKVQNYTKYLYLHVLGEPLLHPQINDFVRLATKKGYYVNITTNGYLIKRLKCSSIRQINVSLHSYNPKYNISISDYIKDMLDKIDELPQVYFSLRFWVENSYNLEMIKLINERYNTNITLDEIIQKKNITVNKHLFLNSHHEFIWPDLNNNYYNAYGKCYALRDHIGILVDGTVVPCCLDTKGTIKLGNIYNENLNTILNSRRVKIMREGFKNNIKSEELCKKCGFFLDKESIF